MFNRYWWVMLIGLVVGPAAGLLISAVITYVMPKQYESSATVEIKVSAYEKSMLPVERGQIQISITNSSHVVTISPILDKSLDSINDSNLWAADKETAILMMKHKLWIAKFPGTDLLNISARSTNREEARDLVAAVVESYSEYISGSISERREAAMQELKHAARKQEQRVEECRKVLESQQQQPNIAGSETPDSLDSKRDFESELAMLEKIKLRIVEEEIGNNLSSDSVVIHDDPVINPIPVLPKVTLNLVLGTAGGLVFSPFLTLPIMWLLGRRRRRE